MDIHAEQATRLKIMPTAGRSSDSSALWNQSLLFQSLANLLSRSVTALSYKSLIDQT